LQPALIIRQARPDRFRGLLVDLIPSSWEIRIAGLQSSVPA
jgi:hypothetical protein